MDLDDLERLMILGAILGFSMVAIGLLGEALGWWNDTGELLISIGSVIGVATTIVALLVNATKGQVRRVADGVAGNGTKLDATNGKLDSMGGQLNSMGGQLDAANGKLDSMGGQLNSMGGQLDAANGKLDTVNRKLEKLDSLDVIQVELDRQTGVMDRQLAVLAEIRDRL